MARVIDDRPCPVKGNGRRIVISQQAHLERSSQRPTVRRIEFTRNDEVSRKPPQDRRVRFGIGQFGGVQSKRHACRIEHGVIGTADGAIRTACIQQDAGFVGRRLRLPPNFPPTTSSILLASRFTASTNRGL